MLEEIKKKLEDKGLSQSSIRMYLRNIEKLNDDKQIKNLNFLKNTNNILKKIENKKPNTQRSYLISIVSILDLFKDKKKDLFETYQRLMLNINDEIKKTPTENMTDTQKENWKTWDEILKDFENLKKEVLSYKGKINKNQYNNLLNCVVTALYIYQEPRRNQDYQLMYKIKNYNDKLNNDVNYIDSKNFIFNTYKTSKKYGQKTIEINDELKSLLNLYYKYSGKPTNKPEIFLKTHDGKPLESVNSITRILNKVFNKKIGSSMLRHIYLTGKYGDKVQEMKETAEKMGHNTQTQKEYIKNDSLIKKVNKDIKVEFQ